MAKRNLEEARIPARAIEIMVNTEMMATITPKVEPANSAAKTEIGSSTTFPSSLNHHSPGTAAIIMNAKRL